MQMIGQVLKDIVAKFIKGSKTILGMNILSSFFLNSFYVFEKFIDTDLKIFIYPLVKFLLNDAD